MNLSTLKNVVTSKAARQVLTAQKHSPTILFGTGVVGVVATVVLASRATLKLEEVLEKSNGDLGTAKELAESNHPDYSETDYKKDVSYIRVRSAVEISKLYGPAVAMGLFSIGCLGGSHHILTKRNAGLVAAYAGLDKGFREYRQRVVNEFGEDKERELRFASETRDIVEETETGPQVKTITTADPNKPSQYARFFDHENQNWNPHPEYNLLFLKAQQNYLNDRLKARGHVLLNDAYDALGMSRTKAGCVVGWVSNSDNGDNYIDFGITNHADRLHDFVVGREGCLMLDFNVDGVVYDLI